MEQTITERTKITTQQLIVKNSITTTDTSGALNFTGTVTPSSVKGIGLYMAGTMAAGAGAQTFDMIRLDTTVFAGGAFGAGIARGVVVVGSTWTSTGTAPSEADGILVTMPTIGSSINTGISIGTPLAGTWGLFVAAGLTSRFNGTVDINNGIAMGGGAVPTLGTIGASGPATAAQNSWLKVNIGGTASYIPVWR